MKRTITFPATKSRRTLVLALLTAEFVALAQEMSGPPELLTPPTAEPPPPAPPASANPPPSPEIPANPAPGTPEALSEAIVDEGFLELRARNVPAAIAAMEKALSLNPNNRRARFGLGTAYISADQHAKARDILEALAKEYPDDYAVRNNLAWLFATSKDPTVRNGKKALDYAREVVLMAPQDHHVWSTLAEAFFVNERYEEALKAARESLRLLRLQTRDPAALKEYEIQVQKCQMAVQALSILD